MKVKGNSVKRSVSSYVLAALVVALLVVALVFAMAIPAAYVAYANDDVQDKTLQGEYAGEVQTQAVSEFKNKVVTITSVLPTARRIDVPAFAQEQGVQMITWDSNYGANQRFKLVDAGGGYYNIINVFTGLALDIFGAKIKDGAKVIQWPLHSGANQKWAIGLTEQGNYIITSALDNRYVLDITGAGQHNGATLIIWKRHNGANQRWTIDSITQPVQEGTYVISTAVEGGRAMDIEGGSKALGARMLLWDRHNKDNQQFIITYIKETGYYTVTNKGSGLSVDVTGASVAKGEQIIQWMSHKGLNQQWAIVPTGQNSFYFIAANSGLALDVFGGIATNNGRIIQWPLHGGANQRWVLEASTWYPESLAQVPATYDIVHHEAKYLELPVWGTYYFDGTPVVPPLSAEELMAEKQIHGGGSSYRIGYYEQVEYQAAWDEYVIKSPSKQKVVPGYWQTWVLEEAVPGYWQLQFRTWIPEQTINRPAQYLTMNQPNVMSFATVYGDLFYDGTIITPEMDELSDLEWSDLGWAHGGGFISGYEIGYTPYIAIPGHSEQIEIAPAWQETIPAHWQ
jgi:hypothetical protein